MFEIMKKRYSVRTYSQQQIEPEKLDALTQFITTNNIGPFGNEVRLKIIDASTEKKEQLKSLGSYGIIKGANVFIAGAVKKSEYGMEDFGYCMEKAILEATRLELGTVWLGGMLSRSNFGKRLEVTTDEVVPAVTPIGYSAEKRSLADKMIRTLSKGNNRKKFEELFFVNNLNKPMDKESAGRYFEALEAVRWAPSASNKQPWRIIKNEAGAFDFYLNEDKKYNNIFKDIKIQNIDMGIAMCHFELAAKELGLNGTWQKNQETSKIEDLKYIISWKH